MAYDSGLGCADSDGRDYNSQGEVSFGGSVRTDHCLASNTVVEFYCDGKPKSEYFVCENGCEYGACLK